MRQQAATSCRDGLHNACAYQPQIGPDRAIDQCVMLQTNCGSVLWHVPPDV